MLIGTFCLALRDTLQRYDLEEMMRILESTPHE